MSGTVRIIHKQDPARPAAIPGIVEVEVNGEPVPLPPRGHDKVIRADKVSFGIYTEPNKDGEEI